MNSAYEHRKLEEKFETYFLQCGYNKLNSVKITSRIDQSVYLVNSATNLFKPFLDRENTRVFAVQRSMRTQILDDYYHEESETEYPTCFESYGVYVSIEQLQKLIDDTIGFFLSLGFERSKMRVRASGDDALLFKSVAASALGSCITIDSRTEKYDHVYGPSLTGRAIKVDYFQEWQQKHKNLCYVIVIFENGVPKGAELATSDQLILMRLFNRQYAVSVAKVSDLLQTNTFAQRRFADSVVGTANLIYEGIKPNSSNTNGRTLKKYLRALSFFGNELHLSLEECIDITCKYILQEYGSIADKKEVLKGCFGVRS